MSPALTSELDALADLGSWIVDVPTGTVTCSAALLAVVGIDRPEGTIRLQDLFRNATEHDRVRLTTALQTAVLATGSLQEDVLLTIDGRARWVRVRGRVSVGNASRVVGSCQDVTESKRHEQSLVDRITVDELTGLPSRTVLTNRMAEAIATLDARPGETVGVLLLDLDRFALVNDRFGRAAGDAVLSRVGDRLLRHVGPVDVVSRFSGDEFVVLCPSVSDSNALEKLAVRILNALAVPMMIDGIQVRITASIGLAQVFDREADTQTALREADAAMYEAKQAGRGRVESFDHEARERRSEQRRRVAEVRAALDLDQYELWYQPVVRLDDSSCVGYEALIRWRHPERGVLGPGEFIPLAEADGSIVELGEWVLREACRYAASTHTSMAVNVSAKQLAEADFVTTIRSALGKSGLAPSSLCLEITETVLMEDIDASIEVLAAVRELGVKVAVDDFGIGYSSLNYLRRLPVDIVKIDRAFTAELGDPAANAIVAAICNLSHALGLEVIAEGVEARQQVIALRALRCDLAQGYLLGWPMTMAEVPTWSSTAWRAGGGEELDITSLVGRRVEAARERSGRHVALNAPQAAVRIGVEPDAVVTIVDELVTNALAYSEADKPVLVRVSSDRRWVRISVSDYGIGMTKHDAERCFEQFFQGARLPINGRRGTGIGLYVVRSLIEDMGGFTAVKTSAKGSTTVTVAMPRQRRTPGAGVGERSSIQEFMKQVGVQPRSGS